MDPERLLDGLNPAQRAAVTVDAAPLCIVAGAGSGKTRVLTRRIAYRVATGAADAPHVLALTFTRKAAGELRHRLAAAGMRERILAGTFHGVAYAQLRQRWADRGQAPPSLVQSKLRLLVPLLGRHSSRSATVQPADIAAEIEWAKARGLSPGDYPAQAGGREGPLAPEVMGRVYAEYEEAKTEQNLVDYGDMLLLATRMLEEHDDVAAEVRDRYRFLTVDEFQDVNPAQWALLRAWLGDRDELCVVGDDDQMIYSFAGASASYLTGFARRFPHAETVTLTTSYRSTPQVLGLANAALPEKPAGLRKELTAARPSGPQPRFHEADDGDAEVAHVVASVRELVDAGVAPGEIAVCYRINSQSQAYEEALSDAGLPWTVRGEAGFFDRSEIRQALRALREAAEQGAHPRRSSDDPPAVGGSTRAEPERADRLVETALRQKLSFHPRREPSGEAARERWRNLTALCDLAAMVVQANPRASLNDVVADLLARAAQGQETAHPEGAVTLCTLHRAKGLEFDAVFLVGLEEGLLPISHARSDAEIEEERRLLYVGITRARRHLTLSWAVSRPGRGGKDKQRRPSRFLSGLGPGAPGKGDRAASGKDGRAARADGRPARQDPSAEPPDDERTAALRAWRKDRAARDGQPAFVVFSDRTMAALAARRPTSQEELLAVPGLGPAKVGRYGDELLAVLRGL